jgi:short subunit dehydrogenase-like uncharacterized protein
LLFSPQLSTLDLMSDRFDVVLYGATGFTGRQTAAYFAAHAPAELRWAIAGRNADKLDEVASETQPHGVIVADSGQPKTVDAMVQQARVLLTTAGPFAKYGTPVVEACAKHGVDYVDITGETPWVRDLIDRFHDRAAASGTRIVPFCGFDSIPSDLGTLVVVDHFRQLGRKTTRVHASFSVGRAGLNGGTLDSAINLAEQDRLGEVGDELLLNPPGHRSEAERERSADPRSVWRDEVRGAWMIPFVMGPINTRVVRRSAALAADYGEPYGDEFTYNEAMEIKHRTSAYAVAGALGLFEKLTERSWGRMMLRRYGPAPGQGPSEHKMDSGHFRTRLLGEATDGTRVLATLAAHGDPGNRVTVMMLCESAMLLATSDRAALPGGADRGGVLTPATALGLDLIDRLKARGLEVTLEAI